MDHGMNGKRPHIQLNKREIEQNIHQETRKMDGEHTRGAIINRLQIIVCIYVVVHIDVDMQTKEEKNTTHIHKYAICMKSTHPEQDSSSWQNN